MFATACRNIGIVTPCLVALFAFGCGNTRAGAAYTEESSTAAVSQLQVTDTAYFSSSDGVEFLVAGDVPSSELSFVHLTFFDADGRPTAIDTDNDGISDATSKDIPASHDTTDPKFFLQFQWDELMRAHVHRVGAQAVDSDGNLSNTVYADLDGRPVSKLGDPCDVRGFDVCQDDSTCKLAPGDWQASCIANASK